MRTCLGRSGRRPRSSAPPRRLAPALARLPRPLPARPPGRPPVTGTSGLTVRPPLCRCTSAPTARGSWDWGSCQRELEPTGRALSRWRSGRRSSRRARRASPRAPTRQLPRRPILPSPASCSSRWPRAPQDSMAPSVPDGPSPNPTVAAATAAAAWQNQSVGVLQPRVAPAGQPAGGMQLAVLAPQLPAPATPGAPSAQSLFPLSTRAMPQQWAVPPGQPAGVMQPPWAAPQVPAHATPGAPSARCHASRVHVHVSVHLINKLSARMVLSRHKLSEGQRVCVR